MKAIFLSERDSGPLAVPKNHSLRHALLGVLLSMGYKLPAISRVRNRGGVNFASRRSQPLTYSAHEGYGLYKYEATN
jgi:hypothetical protein